ncbi:peptidylprolyl isomerase [Paracoccus sp. JM45]|nr:peptidylprolyl isomerase [Paracoccus sp. JM45]
MRTKGKSTVVWILLGLMVMGLGGFGVTSFSGGTTEVGSVGDTKITADEYARALQSQMQTLSQQTGQQITMAQAQQMGLPAAVQGQLIGAAALAEQARSIGVSVGDEQVAQTIMNAGAFQGPNGSFDRAAYSDVLNRERLTEADFEASVRDDEARVLLQNAVANGVTAPNPMVDQTARWLLQTRDFAWRELTVDDLAEPIADPDEATLKAWHEANGDRFTAPETRKISYAWVTPDMLSSEVTLDDAALRAVYDQNIDQFQRPERRMVGRLVFPSVEEAEAARAAIDAGTNTFEDFVVERGLELDDIDLGEVTRGALGQAADDVFAAQQPGVVGPVQTDLGPALFSVNAILDPVDISFEDARDDLRGEAALSGAARQIRSRTSDFEDLLAGGATLEELADDTEMQLGQVDWTVEGDPESGSITGYEAFRERAIDISTSDFPQLFELADGGVFAMRLDEIVPPTLITFEDVRDDVLADWKEAELQRRLLDRASEARLKAVAKTAPGVDAEPQVDAAAEDQPATPVEWNIETGMSRSDYMQDLPQQLLAQAFTMAEPGDVGVVDAGDRVFVLRLDQIEDADLSSDEAVQILDGVKSRLNQSLQGDIFEYYARHVQRNSKVQINQQAINAINAQVQ